MTLVHSWGLVPIKLKPPQSSSKVIERPQLLKLVHDKVGASLIIAHSPPGFGKTTLLRNIYQSYTQSRRSWLTLDEADNDLGRFLFHLLAALDDAQKTILPTNRVGNFHSSINYIGETTAKVFDKVLKMTSQEVLLLDDFELIHNKEVLKTVENLIQALPHGVKLIIGCRKKPTLPLGRLRAHGQLLEIETEHLRFSRQEADHFLSAQGISNLDDTLLARLYQTTEGWVTSLQFAALSLSLDKDATSYIQSFSGSNTALVDYLAEDLLVRQPDDIRNFLMQTSILESFDASLCNAVCNRKDSDKMLCKLEQNNLFLNVFDAQKKCFRYHNMFKDFLQTQLSTYYSDEQIAKLHLDTAKWHATHNSPASAIQHALFSGDTQFAAAIITKVVEPFFYAGRLTTQTGWIEMLPEVELNRHPKIQLYYAWCLLWQRKEQQRLNKLIQKMNEPHFLNNAVQDIRDEIIIIGPISNLLQDKLEESLQLCQQYLKEYPNARNFVRGVLHNISTYVNTHLGNLSDAAQSATAALEAYNQSASIYGQIYADCFIGLTELLQARLQSALAILRGALELAKENGYGHGVPAAAAAAYLIAAQYDANQVEEVEHLLKEYSTMITLLGLPDQIITTQIIRARIALQTEGYTQACQILNELRRHGQQINHSRMVASGWCAQASMAIHHGDNSAASRYLSLGESCEQLRKYDVELWFPTSIRLLLAQGSTNEALSLLNKELREAERKSKFRYALILHILLSDAFNQAREYRKSQKELLKAITLADRESLIRPFIDAGKNTMAAINEFRVVSGESVPATFLKALTSPQTNAITLQTAKDSSSESLTKREFDVLKLLTLGSSNQEISEKLFISLPTVKTHLRKINNKLDAKNRMEAVMIARQKKLID